MTRTRHLRMPRSSTSLGGVCILRCRRRGEMRHLEDAALLDQSPRSLHPQMRTARRDAAPEDATLLDECWRSPHPQMRTAGKPRHLRMPALLDQSPRSPHPQMRTAGKLRHLRMPALLDQSWRRLHPQMQTARQAAASEDAGAPRPVSEESASSDADGAARCGN